jgi:hypothetical protein
MSAQPEYSYVPRKQFISFHNRYQRYAVLCTHRRAGKTVGLGNDLIMGMMECPKQRPQFAFVGPTYTQTKRNAWEYLKEYSRPFWDKPPSESELTITLKYNKAKLFVAGSDNPDQLRGMYLDGVVLDEYSIQRPNVYPEIIAPALSDRQGWAVFAGTPKGKNHFWELLKTAQANPTKYFSMVLKASESGIIPPDELQTLREQMSREEFEQEYECSFEAALVGAIWADEMTMLEREGRARQFEETDWDYPTSVIYDLGFTDATVSLFWQHRPDGENRIVHCYATSGAAIDTHIDYLHSFPVKKYKNVWLPHDAKAKNLQTGKSIVELFMEKGIRAPILRIVPNHKLRDGISAARQVFPSVTIDTSPEAQTDTLVEALKSYRREWNIDLKMFMDRPVHDWASHYADAFRYMCVVSPRSDQGLELTNAFSKPAEFSLHNLWADHAARRALGFNKRI